jgi:hypothetical protein
MGLNNEDIKQLIAILQRGLSSDDVDNEQQTEVVKPSTKPRAKAKTTTKKDSPKHVNMFDKMPESRMHKEDVEIDKKLTRSAPTPRRDAFKPLKIACRVCGKTESIDPSIIDSADRYKCNKCAISAG